MALALLVDPDWTTAAAQALASRMPRMNIVTDRALMESRDIQYIVTFNPPPGSFARLPGLRLICSAGAGAEKLLEAADLPHGVPLVRVVDPATNNGIAQYVVYMLLRQSRDFAGYEIQQREQSWKSIAVASAADTTVGILGLGNLGRAVAHAVAALGFRVAGWSRTPHRLAGIQCHSGERGLENCVRQSRFLVCLLPMTPHTRGILDARLMALLPHGAYVINVARGAHLVPADLIALLDGGHLSGAALDVHMSEPLPRGDPLWSHPRVTVTPHIAWRTTPKAMAEQLCANIERLESGQPLLNEVQRDRGY